MKNRHIHHIRLPKHQYFLAQERQDSITHEPIQEGDKVVFCSKCKSVFTLDSWEYLGNRHCGQEKTLRSIPILRAIALDKRKISQRKKNRSLKDKLPIAFGVVVLMGAMGMIALTVQVLQSPPVAIGANKTSITEEHFIFRGDEFYKSQNFQEARHYYKAALDLNHLNTKAAKRLEQLENEYLLCLEEGDRLFRTERYEEAEYWYMKALLYKVNADYPKSQLEAVSIAKAEAPAVFIACKETQEVEPANNLEGFPQIILPFIEGKDVSHWVLNKAKTEILISFADGTVELRMLEEDERSGELGRLKKTLVGNPATQAVFIENDDNTPTKYQYIAVVGTGNKVYYYFLDWRGTRQVETFSTFHFEKGEEAILSDDGKWLLIQSPNKLLRLYDCKTKMLLKYLRTQEHQPFIGKAFFDLANQQVVARTELGISKWNF